MKTRKQSLGANIFDGRCIYLLISYDLRGDGIDIVAERVDAAQRSFA